MNSGLVVILTALNLEYEAARKTLTDIRVHRHAAGTLFEIGTLGAGGCRVALGLVGKGNHPAAVLAERAIAEFSPAAVLFVGIAGGLWPNIRLGDVVVASQIYAYHGGTSEDDGLKARPRAWEIAHEAGQITQHVIRTGEWKRAAVPGTAPAVHFSPIAAGEVVHDSAISDQARWVRQHYNDAAAIEMEAAGVAQAGHLNRAMPVVVVRGISDRADGTKATTDARNWRAVAAAHAAAFAATLAPELTATSTTSGRRTDQKGGLARMVATNTGLAARRTGLPAANTNLATGNARVGVQAGTVYGNITVGGDTQQSTDLTSAIADLRVLSQQAHRDGKLDEHTYAAAEIELATTTGCLKEDTPQSRTALLVALKRLRGLVADVAELATRLAAIIAVAQGLS